MAWIVVGLLVLILIVLLFIGNEISKIPVGLMMLRDSLIVTATEQTGIVRDLSEQMRKELDRQASERRRFEAGY